MSLLECHDLTKKYGRTIALDGINLSLEANQIVGLLGANGSGKTTLIKLINHLLTPTQGTITIKGMRPGTKTKAIVSYLPDQMSLPQNMTVKELIAYYRDFFADFNEDKCLRMLGDLQIDPKKRIKKMSKGTKEKLQLIMTMSRDASIYLLDEPIAGVDPAVRDYIIKTIVQKHGPDSLVIISTHLIADIEDALDDVIFLHNGRIVKHQDAASLRQETNMSVDACFRDMFRYQGGQIHDA